MPIILKNPVVNKPQEKSEYIWDRESRKLIKKNEEKIVEVKQEPISYKQNRQFVNNIDPVYKRETPSKGTNKHPDHYIKVEDGSLHKFYNTKSQYLKDMAALDNL
jgi:hypothetical protein